MRKNKTMYKFINENYRKLNMEIIKINEFECTYKCLKCGSIKTNNLNSIRRQWNEQNSLHTEACSKYFNDLIKNELNEKQLKQFRSFYRYAKERCCNPNSKDYVRYKDKFHFEDYTHYVNSCYDIYKKAYYIYGENNLSIDRIDNLKGYECGNIRFVPMDINAQNKEAIYPVMAVNIITKQILEAPSLTELSNKYFENKHTSLYQALTENRLYLKTWKIFYTIETPSTIESITKKKYLSE